MRSLFCVFCILTCRLKATQLVQYKLLEIMVFVSLQRVSLKASLRAFKFAIPAKLAALLTCTTMILAPTTSMATVYECNTEQAVIWKHGHLNPESIGPRTGYRLLRFDDKTGVLSQGYDPSLLTGIHTLKIIHRGDLRKDSLVAVQDAITAGVIGDTRQESIIGVTTLQIMTSDERVPRLIFLLSQSAYESILAGQCHIENSTTN